MSGQNSPPQFDVDSNDGAGAPPPYAFNTKVMVGAIILLVCVICFILMLHVYAKWFLRRSSRSYVVNQGHIAQRSAANTGLDKAAISQLPTFVYTAAASPVDNSDQAGNLHQTMPAPECAVCLSEFQENEKGRMLPSCKHIFHTECIDMWLSSHTTCPLCRSNVVPPTTEVVSTDQQRQEQEATEPSQGTAVASSGTLLHPVEYPCNVLFWGNQMQVIASQERPNSSRVTAGARPLPQITIDIPPREGNVLVSASGCLSATKHTLDQEAGPSNPPKSPSLRASIKRMLSRQSSRQKSPGQEGTLEISPK